MKNFDFVAPAKNATNTASQKFADRQARVHEEAFKRAPNFWVPYFRMNSTPLNAEVFESLFDGAAIGLHAKLPDGLTKEWHDTQVYKNRWDLSRRLSALRTAVFESLISIYQKSASNRTLTDSELLFAISNERLEIGYVEVWHDAPASRAANAPTLDPYGRHGIDHITSLECGMQIFARVSEYINLTNSLAVDFFRRRQRNVKIPPYMAPRQPDTDRFSVNASCWDSISNPTDRSAITGRPPLFDMLMLEAIERRGFGAIPSPAIIQQEAGPFSWFVLRELEDGFLVEATSSCGKATWDCGIAVDKGELRWSYSVPFYEGDAALQGNITDRQRITAVLDNLLIVCASIIRDYLVVDERHRNIHYRMSRRRLNERWLPADESGYSIVYLPRCRYVGSGPDVCGISNGLGLDDVATRYEVSIPAGCRRLPSGHSPSDYARANAAALEVNLPEGFTFVRSHVRGSGRVAAREKIYRSRTANSYLFEIDRSAGKHTPIKPFALEAATRRWMEADGWEIKRVRVSERHQDGIDVSAIKEVSGVTILKIAQCKSWNTRTVDAKVIERLVGTAESVAVLHGIERSRILLCCVSASGFTTEANRFARIHKIQLVSRNDLASHLEPVQPCEETCEAELAEEGSTFSFPMQ
jgi:hypothetical protein